MPQTLFDKIWEAHLVVRRADGRDLIYIDRHVLHELHAPHAFEQLERQQRPVRRAASSTRNAPARRSPKSRIA